MSRKADFAEENRYATDCGPACPSGKHHSIDGDTMWIFWVCPDQSSVAQCATCHHAMVFVAPPMFQHLPSLAPPYDSRLMWPDIDDVKLAFAKTRRSV